MPSHERAVRSADLGVPPLLPFIRWCLLQEIAPTGFRFLVEPESLTFDRKPASMSRDATRRTFLTFDAYDDETNHDYEVQLRKHEGKYSVGVSLDTLKNGLPAASNTESMPYLPREEEALEQSLVYYDAYVANILKSARSKGWTLMDRAERDDGDSG